MPARVMRQDRKIQELFKARIREKVAREKSESMAKIDAEAPSWLVWALKPMASVAFDQRRERDSQQGRAGEDSAAVAFWVWLGKDWVVINDLVLEPKPDEFIQVDHVIIGPPGVWLVETKTWEGAYTAHRDNWRRKQGSSWVRCPSPTRQNQRHVELFLVWLKDHMRDGLPDLSGERIMAVILLYRAKWLKVKECSMPVYHTAWELALDLRMRGGRDVRLEPGQVEKLARALATAEPLSSARPHDSGVKGRAAGSEARPRERPAIGATASWDVSIGEQQLVKIEAAASAHGYAVSEAQGKDGRPYVRITGTREEAEQVWLNYKTKGVSVTPLRPDRFAKGVWFFYLE